MKKDNMKTCLKMIVMLLAGAIFFIVIYYPIDGNAFWRYYRTFLAGMTPVVAFNITKNNWIRAILIIVMIGLILYSY
jgi:uncharacterized membrane protein